MRDEPQRVVTARFRIRLSEDAWIAKVSRSFPDATFRLLSGYPTERGAMQLGEARTDAPDAVSEAIESHPSVVAYRRLYAGDERSLARYETTETGFYEFLERTELVVDYPVVVRNGWFAVDFTDARERFDAFREGLEASDRRFELLSVVGSVAESDLLTDRQREVLERALQAGYFEVPRDCTLADVADALDVDKSTASGILRRAQARLVEHHLSAPGVESSAEGL